MRHAQEARDGSPIRFTRSKGLRNSLFGHAKSIIRGEFAEALFDIGGALSKTIDGVPRESTSHEVDHVKRYDAGVIAMEIEWNNKDPFFDRDLENFKRLHAEGAVSVGVLVTRGASLQDALWKAVRRFAHVRNIGSFEDLLANGYSPTSKQRDNVLERVRRDKDPKAFADACRTSA